MQIKEGKKIIDTSSICFFCNLRRNENTSKEQQILKLRSDYMFSHRNLSLYGGHEDEINCLVFSSDFEILLTGSINGYIRIWNTVYDHLTFKIQEKTGRKNIFKIKYILM